MITAVFPLRGWMLDLVVALDTSHPGFAGAYMRASNERRQVIAAFCSKLAPEEEGYATSAAFLNSAGHKSILRRAFGDVPQGMRGVLARVGSQPQDRRFYTSVHRFLSDPRHPSLATAIRRMPEIDFPRLRILNLLPPDICVPSVVELVGDLGTAKDVVRLFEMLVATGVDRSALAQGVCALTRPEQMGKFWDRWISDCPLPVSPLSMMPNCRPTTTVGELFSLARRYRNCAARYAPEALENTSAFGELLVGKDHPGMVVHLRQKRGEWTIEGLFLKQNMRPDADAREAAYQLLERAGVARPPQATAPDGPWSSLRRLTSRPFWDFND